MLSETDFGNTSWVFYVILAYASVGVSLLVFGVVSYLETLRTIRFLNEEGFLARSDEGVSSQGSGL